MLRYKIGDILSENAEAIVNTVNCVGIMGRGIALQYKKAFPENYEAYKAACDRNEIQPGKVFVFDTGRLTNPRYIINFPTKRHWRGTSRLEDVDIGLRALADQIRARKIKSIAIPPLGSGLGGLDWGVVRSRIEQALSSFDNVDVIVFEPRKDPEASEVVRNRKAPDMTAGRAALVGLMERYIGGLLDPFVSLLEIHKLMYFMQEAGEPLRLKYIKALYGPYAENLRHVLNSIEGHLVSGYADGGDNPKKAIQLVPGASKDAQEFLESKKDTSSRFNRVSELVDGFETPFGLELLSTVHWIAKQENIRNCENIIEQTHAWNSRKRQFSERQIRLAYDVMVSKDWI